MRTFYTSVTTQRRKRGDRVRDLLWGFLIEGIQFGANLLTLLQGLPRKIPVPFKYWTLMYLVTFQLIVGLNDLQLRNNKDDVLTTHIHVNNSLHIYMSCIPYSLLPATHWYLTDRASILGSVNLQTLTP